MCWDLPQSSDFSELVHLYKLFLIIRCVKLPTSLRSQLRSRLTAMSSNRDVTTSIIRSHIIRIRSLPPSTKDVLEGGKKRVLETKLNNSLALFGYKDLFQTHFYFCSSQGGLLLQLALVLPVHFPLHSLLYIHRMSGLLQLWRHGKGSTICMGIITKLEGFSYVHNNPIKWIIC